MHSDKLKQLFTTLKSVYYSAQYLLILIRDLIVATKHFSRRRKCKECIFRALKHPEKWKGGKRD